MYKIKKTLLETVKVFETAAMENPLSAWTIASSSAEKLEGVGITLHPDDRAKIKAIMDDTKTRIMSLDLQMPIMPALGSVEQSVDEDRITRQSTLPRVLPVLVIAQCINLPLVLELHEKFKDKRKKRQRTKLTVSSAPLAAGAKLNAPEPADSTPPSAQGLSVPETTSSSGGEAPTKSSLNLETDNETGPNGRVSESEAVSSSATDLETSKTPNRLTQAPRAHDEAVFTAPDVARVENPTPDQPLAAIPEDHSEDHETATEAICQHAVPPNPPKNIDLASLAYTPATVLLPPKRPTTSRFAANSEPGEETKVLAEDPADAPLLVDLKERRTKIDEVTIRFTTSIASQPCGKDELRDEAPEDLALRHSIANAIFGDYYIPTIGDARTNDVTLDEWSLPPFKFLVHAELSKILLGQRDLEDLLPGDFFRTRGAKMILGRVPRGDEPALAKIKYKPLDLFASPSAILPGWKSSETNDIALSRSYLPAAHHLKGAPKPTHMEHWWLNYLNPLQKAIATGQCLAVVGPPGSGKTTACYKAYQSCNGTFETKSHKVYFLSANPLAVAANNPSAFPLSKIDEAVAWAKYDEEDGIIVTFIIDEAQELTAEDLVKFNGGFRQIIFCLDYWQSITAPSHPVFDYIQAAAGSCFEFKMVWRTANDTAFEPLNYLIYGGRCVILPSPKTIGHADRPYRILTCQNDDEMIAISIFVRLRQIALQGKSIALVLANPKLRELLQILLSGLTDANSVLSYLKVYDPCEIRSVETDILIASCFDIDSLDLSLEHSVVLMGLLLGRSRDHLELIVPNDPNESTFAKLLWPVLKTSIYRWDFTLPDGFENFAAALNEYQIKLSCFDEFLILTRRQEACAIAIDTQAKVYDEAIVKDRTSHYHLMQSRGWNIHIASADVGREMLTLSADQLLTRQWFLVLVKSISSQINPCRFSIEDK